MSQKLNARIAVAVRVFAQDSFGKYKTLILRRKDTGEWELPGGKLERDELPWQAAVREMWEETGLKYDGGESIPLPAPPVLAMYTKIMKSGRPYIFFIYQVGVDLSGDKFPRVKPLPAVKLEKRTHDKFEWVGPDIARTKYKMCNEDFESVLMIPSMAMNEFSYHGRGGK